MSFPVPTFQQILFRVQTDLGSFSDGTTPIPSVEYPIGLAISGVSKNVYSYFSWILRQADPNRADEQYGWQWAKAWGVTQKPAQVWRGTYKFTGSNGAVIDAGTELQKPDGSGYTVDAGGTIGQDVSGQLTVNVTAAVANAQSNCTIGTQLTLLSPIAGVDTAGLVQTTTQTGSDQENWQTEGKPRLYEVAAATPSGGGPGDYVRWAKEVPGVTRAWEIPFVYGPGSVAVVFARDNDGTGTDIVPDSNECQVVYDYVNARRPITATLVVPVPAAGLVNVTITNLTPDTTEVRNAVIESLKDLILREGIPGGTLPLSRINEAISAAAGESDHTLISPTGNVSFAANAIPILGTVTFA